MVASFGVQPPPPLTLIEGNSIWKYDDTNTDLGTAWRTIAYDDSSWKQGKGPLGYPADDNNPIFGAVSNGTLVDSQPNPNAFITYYFRKNFTATNVTAITKLEITVGVDDGYVMYIN